MIPVETLLSFHRFGHTERQMDSFITARAGGTPYGCFVQSLRELSKRVRGLRDSLFEREELRLRIQRLEAKSTPIAIQRAKRLRSALEEATWQEQDTHREFLHFYCQAASLYRHLGFDKTAPTPEVLAKLDDERWEHNLLCSMSLDLMTGGLQRGTIESINCLPTETKNRLFRSAFGPAPHDQSSHRPHVESLIQWFLNYDPNLPEPIRLTEEQSARLLSFCESSDSHRRLQLSSQTRAG